MKLQRHTLQNLALHLSPCFGSETHNYSEVSSRPHSERNVSVQAVPLASLVLECLGCGHPGAAGEAIDFFDSLNSVPVAQRHPSLGPPTFAAMLPHLARLAAYPRGFRGWGEELETDSATFHSFRSPSSIHPNQSIQINPPPSPRHPPTPFAPQTSSIIFPPLSLQDEQP